MPSPNPAKSGNRVESAEELLIKGIRELREMESEWRVKGDPVRADAVRKFRLEWFSGPEEVVARMPK